MGGVDEIDVGFATFSVKDRYLYSTSWRSRVLNHLHVRTGVRELAGHDLNLYHSEGEAIDFFCVDRRISKGLWWHVGQGSRTHGQWRHTSVCIEKLRHPKIRDFGFASNQEHIIAGEVTMDDFFGVDVS